MKKLLIPLAVLLLLSSFVSFNQKREKVTLFMLVQENQLLLEQCIAQKDFSAAAHLSFIKDIDQDEQAVEFFCNGWGLVPASRYQGFYYSWNDNTAAIWCGQPLDVMTPSGSGWLWEEANGDNGYYTEHICGHFWYYEAWF